MRVRELSNVWIPLSDGCRLAARIWLPEDAPAAPVPAILEFLLHHAGEVISRDEFLSRVWGEEIYVTPRNVDTHMASLRRKIEDDADHPR